MAVAEIAAEAIKQELAKSVEDPSGSDPVSLEERILELCAENPKGVTQETIAADQPKMDTDKLMKALQRLLSMVDQALVYCRIFPH